MPNTAPSVFPSPLQTYSSKTLDAATLGSDSIQAPASRQPPVSRAGCSAVRRPLPPAMASRLACASAVSTSIWCPARAVPQKSDVYQEERTQKTKASVRNGCNRHGKASTCCLAIQLQNSNVSSPMPHPREKSPNFRMWMLCCESASACSLLYRNNLQILPNDI